MLKLEADFMSTSDVTFSLQNWADRYTAACGISDGNHTLT